MRTYRTYISPQKTTLRKGVNNLNGENFFIPYIIPGIILSSPYFPSSLLPFVTQIRDCIAGTSPPSAPPCYGGRHHFYCDKSHREFPPSSTRRCVESRIRTLLGATYGLNVRRKQTPLEGSGLTQLTHSSHEIKPTTTTSVVHRDDLHSE